MGDSRAWGMVEGGRGGGGKAWGRGERHGTGKGWLGRCWAGGVRRGWWLVGMVEGEEC